MPAAEARRTAVARATGAVARRGRVAPDAEPHDQLLHVIGRGRLKIDKLDKIMGAMARRAGIDPAGTGLRNDDPVWAAAIPAMRQVYEMQQQEEKLLAGNCIQYVRLGYESREIMLKEQMAEMFLFAIGRTLEQLQLTPAQQRAVPAIVEETVRALEART